MYSNYQLPPKMFADLIGHYPRNVWPCPHPVLWKLAQDKKPGLIGNALDFYDKFEKKYPYLGLAARFTPFVSTVPTGIDIIKDLIEKKYWRALARLGTFWIPFGPEIASALKLARGAAARKILLQQPAEGKILLQQPAEGKILPWRSAAAKFAPWRSFIDFWGRMRGLNNAPIQPGNEPVSLPPNPPRPS